MEIRLGILEEGEGTSFQFRDSITLEEHTILKKCVLDLFNYTQSLNLLELVILNARDIHDLIVHILTDIQEKSVKWNGVSYSDMERYNLEANRLLLNYLSSFKTFLDHSETILKRKFGHTSPKVKEYKSFQSGIYDSNFAYRFFYKLRNYAQHCGLPLAVKYSTKKSVSSDNPEIDLKIAFEKNKLLENYDSWGSIKNELAQLPDSFDFFIYFNEATNLIVDIAEKFKETITLEVIESAEYIKNATGHLKTETNKVCMFSEIETDKNNKLKQFLIEYMPYDIINKILR